MADQAGNGELPLRAAQFLSKPAEPPPASLGSRPNGEAAPAPLPSRIESQPQRHPSASGVDVRTMIVGEETVFSGKIASCSRLIVEGKVEATLEDCQHLIINETGGFKGDGATENADVFGSFEGRLVVRKRLLVRATGRVSGTISYGEIEIERGGRIAGAIDPYDAMSSQPGRAPLAKGLTMNRGRRKAARPRDYSQPELAEKNSVEPNGSATRDL